MTDLISRADAIEAVRKKLQDWGGYAFEDYRRGLYEAQDIIEALPSADAVHGEWIKRGTKITCSHCKSAWSASFDTIIVGMKYCPYCGAKMGGDDE